MASPRQDELVYRRGLVMGLTMAEVMVLVLFVLMLLMGYQAKQILTNKAAVENLTIVEREAGVGSTAIPKNFDKLIATIRLGRAVAPPVLRDQLTPEQLAETKDEIQIGREVKRVFGHNTVGQSWEQAVKDFVKSAGQAYGAGRGRFGTPAIWAAAADKALQEKQGNGLVYPPCVTTPDGRPAYVFTARLSNTSILLADRDISVVQGLSVAPLFAPIVRNTALGMDEFRRQTRAVFEWSSTRGCRFFVWINDMTGAAEKRLYKLRLRTVGEHFYYFEPSESVEGRRETR